MVEVFTRSGRGSKKTSENILVKDREEVLWVQDYFFFSDATFRQFLRLTEERTAWNIPKQRFGAKKQHWEVDSEGMYCSNDVPVQPFYLHSTYCNNFSHLLVLGAETLRLTLLVHLPLSILIGHTTTHSPTDDVLDSQADYTLQAHTQAPPPPQISLDEEVMQKAEMGRIRGAARHLVQDSRTKRTWGEWYGQNDQTKTGPQRAKRPKKDERRGGGKGRKREKKLQSRGIVRDNAQ